jgi:hypothetical protein
MTLFTRALLPDGWFNRYKKDQRGIERTSAGFFTEICASHIQKYSQLRLPQIKKAISKEKLTKRGLVSPLEYYLRQHTLLKVRGITRCTQMRIALNRPAELSGRAVFVENHHLVGCGV